MSSYTQTYQPIRVETKLGPDALMLQGFDGVEALSTPFRFQLELLSEKADIDTKAMLRTAVVITFELADGSERKTHGLVSRFQQAGQHEDLTAFRADIVPALWFCSLTTNSRIFQNKTPIDIVEQIFGEHKIADFDIRCARGTKREYCVQYRETDLNFVSRLLEEEGIFYFFEHEHDRHVLVLADKNSAARPIPGRPIIRVHHQRFDAEDTIWAVNHVQSVQTGKVTLRDYDYLQPTLTLEAPEGNGANELYLFPGNFTTPEQGDRYARLKAEALEAGQHEVHCEGNSRSIHCGCTMELTDHYRSEFNREYLLTQVHHYMSGNVYRSGDVGEERGYYNSFVAIPKDTPYRPPPRAIRPVIHGVQTALVVGPGGAEVYTDKHGRVKVQFYWDREGKKNQDSSCWVRVASPWAGKGYGSISIPRVGNEVVVQFLEGDPDRPLIIGSVYNADQTPPFELPPADIQMGIKSRSSKGGGGYNEITLTDTKGKELITIHGQYDMTTTVEHDNTVSIGNDESVSIGNNESISVGANRTESVGKDESISIGDNRTEDVGKNEMVSIGGNRAVSVDKNESLNVGKDRDQTIGAKETVQVGDARQTRIGKDDQLNVGKKLLITVADEILIKTGSASIQMKKDGTITIKGKDININASGKINAKASSDITMKGSKVKQN